VRTIEESDSFQKRLLVACSIFSFIVLSCSFLAQHFWKIEPCRLCKLQRIPYYFLLFIPLLGLANRRYEITKILILCLFLASLILSAYHLLVIGGIVKDFCAVPSQIKTTDDFMNMLNAVPCSEAAWKFLKIPLAGYNLLFSCTFIGLFLQTGTWRKSHSV
jgi:disulfide bond formation protein DsbB